MDGREGECREFFGFSVFFGFSLFSSHDMRHKHMTCVMLIYVSAEFLMVRKGNFSIRKAFIRLD